MMNLIAVFIVLIFFYSLVSGRLERTILTAPILFTVAGMLAFLLLPELRRQQNDLTLLLRVAEIGLVLLLFSDASRIDLRVLQNFQSLPVRLLDVRECC